MQRAILTCLVFSMILLAGAGSGAGGSESDCDRLVAESERLWIDNRFEESNRPIEEAMGLCPDRAEIYWRKARNDYDLIEAIPRESRPPKDELVGRYREMEALGQKCIDLDGDDGTCWLWKGIGMGRRGTTQGILNSLADADEFERVFLKVVSLDPEYRSEDGAANTLGDAYSGLGQLYRVLPEWLCVFPLKQIVGVCGDLDKSLEYNRKSVAREPKRIEYAKELGVILLCHGQKRDKPEEIEEAKKIIRELQSYPELKPSDKIDKQHALMLIDDPSQACGYSRDAQQEQSREAYKEP